MSVLRGFTSISVGLKRRLTYDNPTSHPPPKVASPPGPNVVRGHRCSGLADLRCACGGVVVMAYLERIHATLDPVARLETNAHINQSFARSAELGTLSRWVSKTTDHPGKICLAAGLS